MAVFYGPGSLLIANGSLHDPNFKRTVVLICVHDENGTFGLVLNRPTSLTVAKALPGFPLPPDPKEVLYTGGPVQVDRVQILHGSAEVISNAIPVCEGVFLGGNFGDLPNPHRFYIGYSGWGPGQLDREMEEKAWIVCPAKKEIVFSPSPENLWSLVLKALGGSFAFLATMPENPGLN